MSRPSFKLCRAGPSMQARGISHMGSICCPCCGRVLVVEARVVEADVGRHFEGEVYTADVVSRAPAHDKKPLPPRGQGMLDFDAFNDPWPE